MSPMVLAWIVSLVGAAAFVALGFVVGRRRAPAAGPELVERERVERPDEVAAVEPDASSAGRAIVERALARAKAAPSREDALRELLAALDAGRGTAVLADFHGLPLAAHGDHNPDALAALAGTAGNLLARVEELLPGTSASGLDVRLGEHRILRVRTLDADPHGPVAVILTREPADEVDFESVRQELWRLVAGSPDGARPRPDTQGDS